MALQRENEALQRTVLTSKVQKSEELAQHILKLKEDCDDVLAFILPGTSVSQDEGPGAVTVSNNVTDSFFPVGDQSDVQSASDASSRSAKCFGIGDRVRLHDRTDTAVAGLKLHRKRPYDLVELTTRQGRFTVSKDLRVAAAREPNVQLCEGDLVIVGGKSQKPRSPTRSLHSGDCTVLYEVAFEVDQSVETFHIESYGRQPSVQLHSHQARALPAQGHRMGLFQLTLGQTIEGLDAEHPPCVCGSRLSCTSVRERVQSFVQEEAAIPVTDQEMDYLMSRPPIMCDICNQQVHSEADVWTCENGRRTVLHAVAYDVCQACFSRHTSSTRPAQEDPEDSDYMLSEYESDSSEGDIDLESQSAEQCAALSIGKKF
ncbi:unnamed protein product [Effrenium voratum]|nr:unnamed protein product [Effrenium voratum]